MEDLVPRQDISGKLDDKLCDPATAGSWRTPCGGETCRRSWRRIRPPPTLASSPSPRRRARPRPGTGTGTLPAERIIEMKDKIHERKEHLRQVSDPPVDSINRLLPGEGGGAAVPRGASRRAGPSQHFARHHLAPLLWETFGHLTLCAGNRDTVAVGHLLHCLTINVLRTVAVILYWCEIPEAMR